MLTKTYIKYVLVLIILIGLTLGVKSINKGGLVAISVDGKQVCEIVIVQNESLTLESKCEYHK